MRRTTLLLSMATATGLLSLAAAAAGSAAAATHTLELSGPSTARVGEPVVYRVTGTAARGPDRVALKPPAGSSR